MKTGACSVEAVPKHKARGLTADAFNMLLDRLDADRSRAGEKYARLHRKLVKVFTYEGAESPEDCADEAINRVAKRLEGGESILDLDRYTLGVARLLFKEVLQRQRVARAALLEALRQSEIPTSTSDLESRIAALRICLERLPPESRDLIINYYQGERNAKITNRRKLAEQLRVPSNALRNRIFRLREKLERCLEAAINREE